MKKRYNLFVSIGYPKHIRNSHQRGSGNKSLRRQLHKWCYHLFITKLKHKLQQQGFGSNRVIAVDEKYTSKRCSRCFSLKTTRSSQGRFVCHKCKYELNADLNGARNIAKRLITYALEPIGKFKEKNILCDRLTGDFHKLEHYACFKPLSQWLKYSFGDTSFL
ncbi:MAG: zinc ribbon domain-containing protein [Candidatus Heimdallarchaeaceae archaeon]